MERPIARQPDAALLPFLQAREESETRRQLERLMQEAEPVIHGIIRVRRRVSPARGGDGARGWEGEVAQDVRGEVVTQLLTRLDDLKGNPAAEPIANFRGFVATTTYRICDNFLRKRYPRRASLKNRLRYLLTGRTNQRGLELWEGTGGQWLCGYSAWREEGRTLRRSDRYQELLDQPQAFARAALPDADAAHANPGDLLAALFARVNGPVELDDLVNVVAELWGIRDAPEQGPGPREAGEPEPYEEAHDPRVDVAASAEQRIYLERLWAELRELPPRQATALLLNLRDGQGRGVIALFPLLRIATLRELAAAMALPAEQFAAIWNDLPVEDAAIAELLGVTRQQVIDLRKVARERLARRLKNF